MRPKDLEFGLLGERLGHSFSPAIHRQLAGYDYQLVELPPEEVEPFLRTGRFRGLNVTIPYKKTVMACCDALSPAAERIGSVNTLLRRPDGTLYGDNTDYDGFRYLLQAAGAQVRGKKALVLGSGGASLTVHAVLADLGARETVGISRNGPNNYENLDRHADAQLIVNATPVGMYPNARVSPVDLEQFPNCEGVFDLIYNPARTQLLLDAERPGPCCVPMGWGCWWLRPRPRRSASWAGRSRTAGWRRSPGRWSGRHRICCSSGCRAAARPRWASSWRSAWGRPLADVDQQVEAEAGCSIPDLFAREGEEGFRVREHRVLCQLSRQSGQIIACGGGIVTRQENWDPMRQNSTVIYLRRDLALLPTSGRPVSQATPVEELYHRRAPLYEKLADLTVDNHGTPKETAEEIIRRLAL